MLRPSRISLDVPKQGGTGRRVTVGPGGEENAQVTSKDPLWGAHLKQSNKPTCRVTLFELCTSVSGRYNIRLYIMPVPHHHWLQTCHGAPVFQFYSIPSGCARLQLDIHQPTLHQWSSGLKRTHRKRREGRTRRPGQALTSWLQGPEEVYFLVKPRKLCGRELPGRG